MLREGRTYVYLWLFLLCICLGSYVFDGRGRYNNIQMRFGPFLTLYPFTFFSFPLSCWAVYVRAGNAYPSDTWIIFFHFFPLPSLSVENFSWVWFGFDLALALGLASYREFLCEVVL